jgi:hypothetical protein
MLSGGRGGEVRIKLYLSVSLLASHPPYDISKRPIPSRAWAEMLGLADPGGAGARRVADAMSWLHDERLLEVTRAAGAPPSIKVLSPLGDGKKYSRPKRRWVSLPLDFWSEGWITALSGSGVALLLVLLELTGGRQRSDAPTVSPERRLQYGLSDGTWTGATKELASFGLLSVKRVPQGSDFDWQRLRNTFWIDEERLKSPPKPDELEMGDEAPDD